MTPDDDLLADRREDWERARQRLLLALSEWLREGGVTGEAVGEVAATVRAMRQLIELRRE